MKPDLITTQIKHVDYPVWRATIGKYRDFFEKIIIFFNENNRFPYLDHFLHTEMSKWGNVIFLDQVEIDWGREDWRNVSTNELLRYSTSEWVASIEQDWFAKDWDKLLNAVENSMTKADYIGWWQENNNYIHPSFWFIKRELLDKTSKDFSARPPHDHFGWIAEDVKKMGGRTKTLQEMGFNCDIGLMTDCFHLGGVNQNILEGLSPDYTFHRPEIFYIYNYWSRKANVLQSEVFLERSIQLEKVLAKKFPTIDLEVNQWTKFFRA